MEAKRNSVQAGDMPASTQEPNHSESQIFVRSCNGMLLVKIDLHSVTVAALKWWIEEQTGIPVKEQYLTLGGKPLRDGTLLGDYAIWDESTIDALPRLYGGQLIQLELAQFALPQILTKDFSVQCPSVGHWQRRVLSIDGERILTDIMSLFLKPHGEKKAYNGDLDIKHLCVLGTSDGNGSIVSGTASVHICVDIKAGHALTKMTQEEDYKQLCQIISDVFEADGKECPLHVDHIYTMLGNFLAGSAACTDLERRTHLLKAFRAMMDPHEMATMWWNLGRFEQYLHSNDSTQCRVFRDTVNKIYYQNWEARICKHPHFCKVYKYKGYQRGDGLDLLHFARNWFTHVPKEHLVQDLPDLDYIFSHEFPSFMAEVLEQLYQTTTFDLTEVLPY